MDGLTAALLAADQVLRLLGGSLDLAARRGRVGGDLALDHTGGVVGAVRAPHDLVALLDLACHGPRPPRERQAASSAMRSSARAAASGVRRPRPQLVETSTGRPTQR